MGVFNRVIDWVTTPYTIYLVLKDPAIPASVKWRAGIGLAMIFIYIISPVDIIPDVVPFSGWVDDMAVVPLGFTLLRLFTPGLDVVEKQSQAQKGVRKVLFWTIVSLAGAALVGMTVFALLIYGLIRLITG
jgi:uncharacterized membrane protein YkvA (DUF1232 family)